MTTATVSFESINGTMSIQLDRATFEQVLQVRDLCNELLAAFELKPYPLRNNDLKACLTAYARQCLGNDPEMDFEALADQLKAEIDEVLFYTDLTPFLKEKTVMERMAIPRTTVHRLTINGIVDVPLEDCDYEELEAVRLFCDKRMAELDKMAKSIA